MNMVFSPGLKRQKSSEDCLLHKNSPVGTMQGLESNALNCHFGFIGIEGKDLGLSLF